MQMGEEWDDSLQSKEKIDASLLHKYEAAMRRERALAYSYTHQVLIYPKFEILKPYINSFEIPELDQ